MTEPIDELLGYDRLGDFAPSPDHRRLALVVHGDHGRLAMLATDSPTARPVPHAVVTWFRTHLVNG